MEPKLSSDDLADCVMVFDWYILWVDIFFFVDNMGSSVIAGWPLVCVFESYLIWSWSRSKSVIIDSIHLLRFGRIFKAESSGQFVFLDKLITSDSILKLFFTLVLDLV